MFFQPSQFGIKVNAASSDDLAPEAGMGDLWWAE